MAFPSDIGQDDLATAWRGVRLFAGAIKRDAQNLHALSVAGPVGGSQILDFLTRLADNRAELARYTQVAGLAAYAQEQINDPALDVAAAFVAMRDQADACRDWAIANFPKDGNGFLLARTFLADGRTQDRQFTAAALAPFRTQLQSLIATID